MSRHQVKWQKWRNVVVRHTPSFMPYMVLQLDLHIPNFEVLNLNTSAFFVRLEMSTRTQGFMHLRTCTYDFFKSSIFYMISTNILTHVLTRFVLIAHKHLFGKRLVFAHFLSLFYPFSLRCCHCIQRWVPHSQSAALTLREQPELEQ